MFVYSLIPIDYLKTLHYFKMGVNNLSTCCYWLFFIQTHQLKKASQMTGFRLNTIQDYASGLASSAGLSSKALIDKRMRPRSSTSNAFTFTSWPTFK